MSDKGTMIELRVDTERIKEIAPLHLRTPLVGPRGNAAIAVGEGAELRRVAESVQVGLAHLTGAELPLVDAADFATAGCLPRHLIAIGHAGNNGVLRRLHDLRLLGDRDYPSEGIRAVSVHSPLGDGHNVIAALGYTPVVAEASAMQVADQVVLEDGEWGLTGRLFEANPRPKAPAPDQFLAEEAGKSTAERGGRPSSFVTALRHLNATGEARWARAFVKLVTPYATGEIPLSFWLMSAVDFWTDELVIGWDMAEEFPHFADEERRLVTNFIVSCTEYCHDSLTYQKWRITEDEHQLFNHSTFPARGLYFGCMYLRRHGYDVLDIEDCLEKCRRVFARASEAGRSFDEGGAGYSWLVGTHLLQVSLAQGDTSYARSSRMIAYADLAVMIQNNHFQQVPFGDCGSYHGSGGNAANILLRAAEWHQEPGYRWVVEKCAPAVAAADVRTCEMRGVPPEKHVGLFVLPLDPVIHRWTDLPRFPNYPPPLRGTNVPADECFDKLSLRGGWHEDDDYLLLQGFGCGQHGHPDANAISQYQVRGRLFLAENDYIRRMPKQHNMVMVIRDGQHAPIPVTARLDATAEFAGGAMTKTTLLDYNGCDWTRVILWVNGDCVLVIDSLKAIAAGDYELRCYWRTLGDAERTEQGLHADHAGEHFHVLELTDSDRRMEQEDVPLNGTKYPEYKYGSGSPKILCEQRKLMLHAGEECLFVNLLLPNGQTAEPRRSLAWENDGTVLVGGAGPAIRVNAGAFAVEGVVSRELSEVESIGLSSKATAERVAPIRLPESGGVAVQWQVALPAPATCLASLAEDATLVGCEDGSIVKVDAQGCLQTLAKAEGRVGAVLAGRLFGESETTCLAAAYDCKLRLLTEDGRERMTVELAPNSHMPAWGRALCLADLDGDGRLWPIVGTAAWRVHAVTPEGELRWTFDTAAHSVTCLAAGDLNGDGCEEIVIGTVYFCVPAATADGGRLWQDEDYNDYWRAGPTFPFIHIADVDSDGELEAITAGSDTLVHCISNVGEKKWTYSIGDDPAGLVVFGDSVVAASLTGDVHCIDGRGVRRWRLVLGSPCTALAGVGDIVFVATEAGAVVAVDRAGEAVGRAGLAAPARHLFACGNGAVLAADGGGALTRLRNGR